MFGTGQPANTAREQTYNVVSYLGFILKVFSQQITYFIFTFGYVRSAFLSKRARSFWIPMGAKIILVVILLNAVLLVSAYILNTQYISVYAG